MHQRHHTATAAAAVATTAATAADASAAACSPRRPVRRPAGHATILRKPSQRLGGTSTSCFQPRSRCPRAAPAAAAAAMLDGGRGRGRGWYYKQKYGGGGRGRGGGSQGGYSQGPGPSQQQQYQPQQPGREDEGGDAGTGAGSDDEGYAAAASASAGSWKDLESTLRRIDGRGYKVWSGCGKALWLGAMRCGPSGPRHSWQPPRRIRHAHACTPAWPAGVQRPRGAVADGPAAAAGRLRAVCRLGAGACARRKGAPFLSGARREDTTGQGALRQRPTPADVPAFPPQGDPFASPSRCRVVVPAAVACLPPPLISRRTRRTAVCDYLTRSFGRAVSASGASAAPRG